MDSSPCYWWNKQKRRRLFITWCSIVVIASYIICNNQYAAAMERHLYFLPAYGRSWGRWDKVIQRYGGKRDTHTRQTYRTTTVNGWGFLLWKKTTCCGLSLLWCNRVRPGEYLLDDDGWNTFQQWLIMYWLGLSDAHGYANNAAMISQWTIGLHGRSSWGYGSALERSGSAWSPPHQHSKRFFFSYGRLSMEHERETIPTSFN